MNVNKCCACFIFTLSSCLSEERHFIWFIGNVVLHCKCTVIGVSDCLYGRHGIVKFYIMADFLIFNLYILQIRVNYQLNANICLFGLTCFGLYAHLQEQIEFLLQMRHMVPCK